MRTWALAAWVCASTAFADELRDYTGILHCHSHHSHDSEGTEVEIIAAAREAKIDYIFMTDHPSEKSLSEAMRGDREGVLFVGGAEVNGLLALDIRTHLESKGKAESVKEILKQGGLAFVAHPEEWTEEDWAVEGLTGMEIYNLHADVKDESTKGMLEVIPGMEKDPETAIVTILDAPTLNLKRWDDIGQKRRFVGIAANDAHQNVKLMGLQLDPYARVFKFVRTHILAKSLSLEALREGLCEGRVYVAFEIFGEAKGFTFRATREGAALEMGSESKFADGWKIEAKLPLEASWKVMKNGKTHAKGEGKDVTCDVDGPGVWRLEARRKDAAGKWRPWIYGNPVYFRD